MRILLDTSVLVAALARSHPRHSLCLPWLARAHRGDFELVLAAHTLAELHAVLTTLPVRPRISPRTALRLTEDNQLRPPPRGCAEVIALSVDDYLTVVEAMVRQSLSGGIVYDALIAKAADLGNVDRLVTLNPDHFRRVWQAEDGRVRGP